MKNLPFNFVSFLGTVGSLVGAITGALIGLATESGLFRGAGIGAISGAVFSIEAVESSLALWHSNDSGIWSILYVVSHGIDLTNLCKRNLLFFRKFCSVHNARIPSTL